MKKVHLSYPAKIIYTKCPSLLQIEKHGSSNLVFSNVPDPNPMDPERIGLPDQDPRF